MDRIVVDSSVVIKWLIDEPYSTEARRLLNDYQQGALRLLSPDLLNAEIGSILWKKHSLQGLAAADAQQALDAFGLLQFDFSSSASLLTDAYHLAVTHQRSVYDSLYLALSLREQCPFVTADERLVNAVQAVLPHVIWIAKWP